jgi:phosphoribosylamine--glycine ligase
MYMRLSQRSDIVVGVVGQDGRTSAIIDSLEKSPRLKGPVILLSSGKGSESVAEAVTAAKERHPDLVVIGPEEPLALGVVDKLAELGIPCIGPRESLAKLESSKAFTRGLLATYDIPGNPRHSVFSSLNGIADYLRRLDSFVIKPDGLTGGKGVKVFGDHLHSIQDALGYCHELFDAGEKQVVVEERLDGEEFSLQSFCDGTHVVHMPPVQDHKRAYDGDTGPNTGGMGSYSDFNLSLPFLDTESLSQAQMINEKVARALHRKTGEKYKGVLFGGFMLTGDGLRLLEYNARFGDPEALNVLSLIDTAKTDFLDICTAIVDETLDEVPIEFRRLATVCKYVVPKGYPGKPEAGQKLDMSMVPAECDNLRIFRAAVAEKHDGIYLTGSRAIAFVGMAPELNEAERIAESAAAAVRGPVRHRKDIGTSALINRRVAHVRALKERGLLKVPASA